MTFYEVFKKLCDERGISCKKAAMDMGLSNSTPSKWKKTGCTPKAETLEKVSAYFDVHIEDLLGKEYKTTSVENLRAGISYLFREHAEQWKNIRYMRVACVCNSIAIILIILAVILA